MQRSLQVVVEPSGCACLSFGAANLVSPCRSKGYGFVSFRTQDAAEKGIAMMNGKLVGNRHALTVPQAIVYS